jgi:single-strand DNA-binding protein
MRNQFNGTGRLTRDPELKYTQSGTAVANFSIAINDPFKDKNGNERPAFFLDCEAWGKTAETIANPEFFEKGRLIEVIGRLATDSWEDKTSGDRRSKTKCVVDRFEFPQTERPRQESRDQGGDEDGGTEQEGEAPKPPTKRTTRRRPQATRPAAQDEGFEGDGNGDSIPF